jgi:hypothetical protein
LHPEKFRLMAAGKEGRDDEEVRVSENSKCVDVNL